MGRSRRSARPGGGSTGSPPRGRARAGKGGEGEARSGSRLGVPTHLEDARRGRAGGGPGVVWVDAQGGCGRPGEALQPREQPVQLPRRTGQRQSSPPPPPPPPLPSPPPATASSRPPPSLSGGVRPNFAGEVESFWRVNSGGECGAPRWRGGGIHGFRGASGGVPARRPGFSQKFAPRARPSPPLFTLQPPSFLLLGRSSQVPPRPTAPPAGMRGVAQGARRRGLGAAPGVVAVPRRSRPPARGPAPARAAGGGW